MPFDGTPELVSVIKSSNPHLDIEQSASAIIKFEGGESGICQILNMTCSREMALLNLCILLAHRDGKIRCAFNAASSNRSICPFIS